MNYEFRNKFKKIYFISKKGSSLKGDIYHITLKDKRTLILYGNTQVDIFDKYGERKDVLVSELNMEDSLYVTREMEQYFIK